MFDDLDERLGFLGCDPSDAETCDFGNPDELEEYLEDVFPDDSTYAALQRIVANQILTDAEPAAWATAQRMTAAGHDTSFTLSQMAMVLSCVIDRTLEAAGQEDQPASEAPGAGYVASLELLPLPSHDELISTIAELAGSEWVDMEAIEAAVTARIATHDPAGVVASILDMVVDEEVAPGGALAFGPDDTIIHVPTRWSTKVLTRRLTAAEIDDEVLNGTFDLAPLIHHGDALQDQSGHHLHSTMGEGRVLLVDATDALPAGCAAGDTIAVRVDANGTVSMEVLDPPPALDADVVAALYAAYQAEVAEVGLPVDAAALALRIDHDHPELLNQPAAPLSELAEAAGLEIRGDYVADDEHLWWNLHATIRLSRVFDALGDVDRSKAVLRILRLADRLDGWDNDGDVATPAEALVTIRDPEVLTVVGNALFFPPSELPATNPLPLIDSMEDAARSAHDRGVVGWLRTIAHERRGDLTAAEAALAEASTADPNSAVLADRRAWYASDRGDAATARRLWQMIDPDATVARDLANVEEAHAFGVHDLGRNEPCWCGSGRKFKQCHLGATTLPPLPDRVGWLCGKAAGFVDRRGGEIQDDYFDLAVARAVDPDNPRHLQRSFEDPLTMDLLLHEGGWFERFLDERGSLLPEDELLLGQAWSLVARTIYEITQVEPGARVEVRDLRSAELTWVRERTFSRDAKVGMLICARAVPDGAGHQFLGGIFTVRVGHEAALLDLLDDGDPLDIATWVADCERGPVVVDRDGNPTFDFSDQSMFDLAEAGRARRDTQPSSELDLPDPQVAAVLEQVRDRYELQWCDEVVPALGNVTPRQAAADPTRRDSLLRLLDELEHLEVPGDAVGMRAARLRELLDLTDER